MFQGWLRELEQVHAKHYRDSMRLLAVIQLVRFLTWEGTSVSDHGKRSRVPGSIPGTWKGMAAV